MFHVGQKVVYIGPGRWEDQDGDPCAGFALPVPGPIYTIFEISQMRGKLFLTLNEFSPRWAFGAKYFRPVVERKTDISIFTDMLLPNKLNERV
jgi:hypothetical protein